jgi:hypothetical protein
MGGISLEPTPPLRLGQIRARAEMYNAPVYIILTSFRKLTYLIELIAHFLPNSYTSVRYYAAEGHEYPAFFISYRAKPPMYSHGVGI